MKPIPEIYSRNRLQVCVQDYYNIVEMCARKQTIINKFSDDTFTAFEPFINVFGCGKKVHIWESGELEPRPLITKETKALFRRYKDGERNLYYQHGGSFQPWHFVNGIFSPKHVDEQIFGHEVYYYTSNYKDFGLGYLDGDAHCLFQADITDALSLLDDLFPDKALWRDSTRGHNGYLKIYHGGDIEFYNATLERLEKSLQLYIRSWEILSDIEVKGGIHTKEKNADLAKLPFSTFLPSSGRQSWNYDMLREFQALPILPVQHLARIADELDASSNRAKATACEERVRSLKQAEREAAANTIREGSRIKFAGAEWLVLFFQPEKVTLRLRGPAPQTVLHRLYRLGWEYRLTVSLTELRSGIVQDEASPTLLAPVGPPTPAPLPVADSIQMPESEAGPADLPIPRIKLADIEEPDSYKRQLDALLVFARKIKRVPSLAEALMFVKENDLYTGSWSENLARRKARVRHILKHLAKTFDPGKCNRGQVEVEKFRAWAEKTFPSRIPIHKTWGNGFLEQHSCRVGYVTHEDIAVYLALFEFCLDNGQFLNDNGIPQARLFALWQKLYQEGKTFRSVNDAKITEIRELLNSRQIINITDRGYSFVDHTSMKYDFGKFFPGKKLYREPKAATWRVALDPRNPRKFLIVDLRVSGSEKKSIPNTVPTFCRSTSTTMECLGAAEWHFDTS